MFNHPAKFTWLLIAILLSAFTSYAQNEPDITGLWKGQLYNDTTNEYLPYELAISMEKGKLTGYSLTAFKIEDHYEVGIKELNIKRVKDKILIEDKDLLSNTYSVEAPKGVRQRSVLELTVKDTVMILSGKWSTNRTRKYLPLTGTMKIQRKNDDYKKSELVKHLDTLQISNDLSFVAPEDKKLYPVATSEKQINKDEGKEEKEKNALAKQALQKQKEAEKKTQDEIKKQEREKELLAKQTLQKEKEAEKKAEADIKKQEKDKELLAKQALQKQKEEEKKAQDELKKQEREKELTAKLQEQKDKEQAKEKEKQFAIAAAKRVEDERIRKANAGPAADIATRKTIVAQTVFYKADSLTFTLYDNGEVGGDTVTVLMNKSVIFAKQGLTEKGNSKTIYITKDTPDSINVVMYAESLGIYPPNTGLLVIRDGQANYEVRFSADLQTNSEIILRRKPKE